MPGMTDLLAAFRSTLDDERVSRSERRALRALLADHQPDEDERARLRAALFAEVRGRLDRDAERLVAALEDAIKVLADPPRAGAQQRVWFGPEEPMADALVTLIEGSRKSIDVAVFTITDDRVSNALQRAHDRGVPVRILTDDDKARDKGSDVDRLARHGLAVRFDQSPHHFHHKFAVFDRRSVVTGSYNWTRSADAVNRENFLLSDDPSLVGSYASGFDRMWRELA